MRPPATHPPILRLCWWDAMLREERFPSLAACCAQFETSPRTAFRDLEYLRDQFRAPIAYDRDRRGYYYTEKGFSLPAIRLTEGEIVALFLAEQVLRQYRGTRYGAELHEAFVRLCAALPEEVSLDLGMLADAFSFDLGPARPVDVQIHERVVAATLGRCRLAICYYVPARDELTERQVDPLHVYASGGDLYVAAFCHLRGRVQDFALSRIRSVEETGERFTPPADFDREAYLR